MRAFHYARATSVEDAAALIASEPDAVYLAGGTNLVDLMKLGVARPNVLVDIGDLGLDRIEHGPDGGVMIGATVRNSDLAGDVGIRERFPVLAQALLAGASGQLRSVATTAGNLLQRTRCPYFQDVTKPCNKRDPGAGCSAIEGAHRDLGLLGTSEACVATHPSDMAVALAALEAIVHVRRCGGEDARFGLDDFYRLPGDAPGHETVLENGDLVIGVELPPPHPSVMRYRKVRDRASYAFAVASIAAVLPTNGSPAGPRIALGGVAPRPWRCRHVEQALCRERASAALLRSACAEEFAGARPLPGNAFKLDLATELITATVLDMIGGK